METAGTEAIGVYNESRDLMLVLGAVALLSGFGVAFLITRSITRQWGGEPAYVAEVIGRVAEGDLSVLPIETRNNDH